MATKDQAWQRQIEQNEAWDGEREIRAAAKRRFEAEWKANGPAVVTVYNLRTNDRVEHRFDTRKAAEAFAEKASRESYVTVFADRKAAVA